jgi:GrpB-like predicted nucleotidyltransferase (UPF0157 family)
MSDKIDEIAFEKYHLGMLQDKVSLSEHRSEWKSCFDLVSAFLTKTVTNDETQIHHVGSTAIPFIKAKPILDIMVVVPKLSGFDSKQEEIENFGFTWKGEYGISGRRYCVKYNSKQTIGFVHLHAFEAADTEVERHLLFRDYLLAFPTVAQEYSKLKNHSLEKYSGQREAYTESKSKFIQSVIERARSWKSAL